MQRKEDNALQTRTHDDPHVAGDAPGVSSSQTATENGAGGEVTAATGASVSAPGKPHAATTAASDDLNDLSRLRLSQNYGAGLGVRKKIVTVRVGKPNRQTFFRVHPDPEYKLETALLELKDERESYLVEPSLWPELSGDVVPKVLFTTCTPQGLVSLWPVRLPDSDGRYDEWSRSALEGAGIAQRSWIKIVANMQLGAYEIYEALGEISDPKWPDLPFTEIVKIAFKGRYIKSLDHPAVKRLRGEL